jgi:uncharacterized protein HemY
MLSKTNTLIITSIGLLIAIYFGCNTLGNKQKEVEKSRLSNMEATSLSNLVSEANKKLSDTDKSQIEALQLELESTGTDTLKKISVLKTVSAWWYQKGHPSISGTYAEEVAKLEKSENAWSITGTTYALCVKNIGDNKKEKEYCSKRAINAFEKAISISPDNVDHRVNLAICYVDNPTPDNPMQGILMLRELNTKYPKNVTVLNQLGKLAIQTNQFDKAITRLEDAISVEPNNNTTICLLAQAYNAVGDAEKAKIYVDKCQQ